MKEKEQKRRIKPLVSWKLGKSTRAK
jgi:hypothetical protein